ncbi:ribosome biogenesis factor YjgA [Deltaproteobacteria bacterium IMCC39524]|nr:ribosome biogenesis factor YjgA [Deltaproteobacteria bacterium IMCC39524]
MHRYEEEEVRSLGRGRSAKKREAKAIEELAQRLTEITASELGKLPKSPELSTEIELARSTKGNSSRKRQIKHLAGMLRDHEEQRLAIEAALDGQSVSQRQETLAFHHLEELRDRICATETCEAALTEVRTTYPHLDAGKLARLARSVHEHSDKKAAREIFRRLRKAEESNEV